MIPSPAVLPLRGNLGKSRGAFGATAGDGMMDSILKKEIEQWGVSLQ